MSPQQTSVNGDTPPRLCRQRGSAARLVPGLAEDPERRFTYGGRVAHLLAYDTDYQQFPYATAYCGRQPQWSTAWLGSGSQDEYDEATRMPLCKQCLRVAQTTAEWIADLKADLDQWKASKDA